MPKSLLLQIPPCKRPPCSSESGAGSRAPARATARTDAREPRPWYRGRKPAAAPGGLVQATDEATGEVRWFSVEGGRTREVKDPKASRRQERYRLQTHAGYLLRDWSTPRGNRYAVGRCQRFLHGDAVEVCHTGDRAHLKGLVQCGSVWHCAICAAKLAERRRDELCKAVEGCKAAGGATVMVTLTLPHKRQDKLDEMLKAFHEALAALRASRAYKGTAKDAGVHGHVRALEVTWGEENGWHPHVHELVFLDAPSTPLLLKELQSRYLAAWQAACRLKGLPEPSAEHGVDVREALTAGDYMSKFGIERKWGPDAEMTRSHLKKGRGKRFSPWDLLQASYQARVVDGKPSDRMGALWVEYAKAFHSRRQLFWSKGLKARYDVADLTDEELVSVEEAPSVTLVSIPETIWLQRFALGKRERRGLLLDIADQGDAKAVEEFVRTVGLEARHGQFWRDHLKWDGPAILRESVPWEASTGGGCMVRD